MIKEADYKYLVEKLAEEIIENAVMEKEAAEAEETKEEGGELSPALQAILAKKDAPAEEEEEKEEEMSEEDKEAAEIILAAIEKAASVFEEAEAMEKAAQNVFQESQIYKEAALKVFADCGLLDDEE